MSHGYANKPSFKRQTLVDFDGEQAAWSQFARVKLIDPADAIELLASGGLDRPFPAKVWYRFAADNIETDGYFHYGKQDLAEELIVDAVKAGFLRCVSDVSDRPTLGSITRTRLDVIDPEQFKSEDFVFEWSDEGYQISTGDDDHYIEERGFLFFWDELCRLRPSLIDLEERGSSVETPKSTVPEISVQMPHARRTTGTRRGRPSGRNGRPIAAFTLRVLQNLEEFRAVETDDPLGLMLIEEYERLGLSGPNLDNAAKDARGVIDAVMQFQSGGGKITTRD